MTNLQKIAFTLFLLLWLFSTAAAFFYVFQVNNRTIHGIKTKSPEIQEEIPYFFQ